MKKFFKFLGYVAYTSIVFVTGCVLGMAMIFIGLSIINYR